MRMNEMRTYERPEIEGVLVNVEMGFAGTNYGSDWGDSVDPYEPVTPPGGEDLFPDDEW